MQTKQIIRFQVEISGAEKRIGSETEKQNTEKYQILSARMVSIVTTMSNLPQMREEDIIYLKGRVPRLNNSSGVVKCSLLFLTANISLDQEVPKPTGRYEGDKLVQRL